MKITERLTEFQCQFLVTSFARLLLNFICSIVYVDLVVNHVHLSLLSGNQFYLDYYKIPIWP